MHILVGLASAVDVDFCALTEKVMEKVVFFRVSECVRDQLD